MSGTAPTRNLGLDVVRVTEAAALAASRWMGRGKPDEADCDAADAMVAALNTLEMQGRIVIGEEGKLGRHSPLDSGVHVGTGNGPAIDVVVDPIDGRRRLALGYSDAISVVGLAPRDSMWAPAPAVYLEKIVVGREAAAALVPECLDAPAAWTLALVARVKHKPVRDLVVFVLDRPRHHHLVEELRTAGARVMLRSDGDIAGALMAAYPGSGVDLLMGVGGVAEGVVAACAIRALHGKLLARVAPQSEQERSAVRAAGLDLQRILSSDEMVQGSQIFFAATGITDGLLLSGVRLRGHEAETNSLVLRAETGTRRVMHATHRVEWAHGEE